MTLKPAPRFSSDYIVHRPGVYAKHKSKVAPGYLRTERSNFQDIFRSKFGISVPLASVGCSVIDLIGMIFSRGCPPQVDLINAPKVAVPTGMRGFGVFGGWRSISGLTSKSVSVTPLSVKGHQAVAASSATVRPDEAIIAAMRQHNGLKKSSGLAFGGAARKRISVPLPSLVVRTAPAARPNRLAAFVNRAYRGLSHFDLLTRLAWLEPVAALERSAGSSFVLQFARVSKQ